MVCGLGVCLLRRTVGRSAGTVDRTVINDQTLDADGRCFADHVGAAFVYSADDSQKYQKEVGGDVIAAVQDGLAAMFDPTFIASTNHSI